MSFTVTMPQLGETVTEGTVLGWMKQPGDLVAEDDVLLEISTDKVDTEVPSPFSGTLLAILVPEGETVDVGTALAVIGEAGESVDPEPVATPAAVAPAPESAPGPEPALVAESATPSDAQPPPAPPLPAPVSSESVAAAAVDDESRDLGVLSPVVRRLGAEHGIDLAAVTGTGHGGRITRRDVEGHIASAATAPQVAVPQPASAAETPARRAGLGRGIGDLLANGGAPPVGIVPPQSLAEPVAAPETVAEPVVADALAPAPMVEPVPAAAPAAAGENVEPISRLRSRIAANMIAARQTAAHVWTSMEVDFESVERVRQGHKGVFTEREGFGLTYLPFISRATIDALAVFPVVNSSFDFEAGTRTFHGHVNLGIGVDLDQEGLVVMTVRGADGLRLRGIGREVDRLAQKARDGNMEPDDLAGSTFTITNAGPFGSYMSAPIINVPNVAILSTDGIKKRPVVISDDDGNDAIAIRHIGYLSLSWDHRAFDGSTAALFLGRIRENLESWDWEQELA